MECLLCLAKIKSFFCSWCYDFQGVYKLSERLFPFVPRTFEFGAGAQAEGIALVEVL